MSAEHIELLPPEAQEALWEIARTVLDMNATDQYLAKVSAGQVAAHLAANGHGDHVPGALLVMAACKFAHVIENANHKQEEVA